MSDYLAAIERQNVVKAVYMEVGAPAEFKKKEAEWALGLCEDPSNPTVGAVISANPTDADFKSYIGSLAKNHYLKGIRYGFSSAEEMMSTKVIDNIRFMGESGLSFDLNLPPDKLSQAGPLLEACPGTRFVLNHCGNADPVAFFSESREKPREARHNRDQWYADVKVLAQRDNIICKISGMVDNVGDFPLTPEDLAPIINHCYQVFGPDRVIFASDWPVCIRNMSLAQWIETVKQVTASWPIDHQKKLFHGNAFSFYGLQN